MNCKCSLFRVKCDFALVGDGLMCCKILMTNKFSVPFKYVCEMQVPCCYQIVMVSFTVGTNQFAQTYVKCVCNKKAKFLSTCVRSNWDIDRVSVYRITHKFSSFLVDLIFNHVFLDTSILFMYTPKLHNIFYHFLPITTLCLVRFSRQADVKKVCKVNNGQNGYGGFFYMG